MMSKPTYHLNREEIVALLHEVQGERDELLAASKAIVPFIAEIDDPCTGEIVNAQYLAPAYRQALETFCAAIAKVKKTPVKKTSPCGSLNRNDIRAFVSKHKELKGITGNAKVDLCAKIKKTSPKLYKKLESM